MKIMNTLDMISFQNPFTAQLYFSEAIIQRLSTNYHPRITKFYLTQLKTLSGYKYRINLNYFVSIFSPINHLIKQSDILILLNIIKYCCKVNDEKYYPLYSKQTISIEKRIFSEKVDLSDFLLKFQNFIFENFEYYCEKITSSNFVNSSSASNNKIVTIKHICDKNEDEIDEYKSSHFDNELDYLNFLGNIFVAYFENLYYIRDHDNFVFFIQNQEIKNKNFVEWFCTIGSDKLDKISPKLNRAFMQNIEVYLIKQPVSNWWQVENAIERKKGKLLYWKNDMLYFDEMEADMYKPEEDDVIDNLLELAYSTEINKGIEVDAIREVEEEEKEMFEGLEIKEEFEEGNKSPMNQREGDVTEGGGLMAHGTTFLDNDKPEEPVEINPMEPLPEEENFVPNQKVSMEIDKKKIAGPDNNITATEENKTLENPTLLFKLLLLSQMKKFNNIIEEYPEEFKGKPKEYMSYFKKIIAIPVYSYVYRTLLFYSDYKPKIRYYFYEIIVSFLTTFSFFLDDLLNTEYFSTKQAIDTNIDQQYFFLDKSYIKQSPVFEILSIIQSQNIKKKSFSSKTFKIS